MKGVVDVTPWKYCSCLSQLTCSSFLICSREGPRSVSEIDQKPSDFPMGPGCVAFSSVLLFSNSWTRGIGYGDRIMTSGGDTLASSRRVDRGGRFDLKRIRVDAEMGDDVRSHIFGSER